MAVIKEGTLLSFSGGEWSDKWTNGPFEVLIDFDQQEVVNSFLAGFEPDDEWDNPDENGFVAWLAASGYIRDVGHSFVWYMGGYDFDPVISNEKPAA